MNFWYTSIFEIFLIALVTGAVVPTTDDVDEQGLYRKSDQVEILTNKNFEKKLYGQNNALLVQFYNSYCGHCRAFSPKYKALASDIARWKKVIKLAVIDCFVEENSEICRQFEVMAYPSIRYFHENYMKSNSNVGEKMNIADTAERLKNQLIIKLQAEQSMGRLIIAPSFKIESYTSYASALQSVPGDIDYIFLVFENDNSTIGSQIALDVVDYKKVRVKRVYENSELAQVAGVKKIPSVVALENNLQATLLTPKQPTAQNILEEIDRFLKSKNYVFPPKYANMNDISDSSQQRTFVPTSDVAYYNDLEKTLKASLHTEITRHKTLTGEPLQALLDYLDVIKTSFPFRANLGEYIMDLHATLAARNSWTGGEVYDLVKRLETAHEPVYITNLEYVGCKGSEPKYRGYTCGLWTLFHTLTVNAAQKPGSEGPKVLKAMHGYVKNFFGCTECASHFQAMAARNRIFDVKENNKAVLWLWISHNEVNLRLAGDVTEDPEHPKIQFPSATKCPECRLAQGAWNLVAVYDYLQKMYGANNIKDVRRAQVSSASSTFSNLDIGMLSLLIASYIIINLS